MRKVETARWMSIMKWIVFLQNPYVDPNSQCLRMWLFVDMAFQEVINLKWDFGDIPYSSLTDVHVRRHWETGNKGMLTHRDYLGRSSKMMFKYKLRRKTLEETNVTDTLILNLKTPEL